MLIRESPRGVQKNIVTTTSKDQAQISRAIDKLVEVGLVVRTEGSLMAQGIKTWQFNYRRCEGLSSVFIGYDISSVSAGAIGLFLCHVLLHIFYKTI